MAVQVLAPRGFDIVAYDYSPVPLSHEGAFILPTILAMKNVPDDMEKLWCHQGYYGRDPVMEAARHVSQPFFWTHRGRRQSDIMRKTLAERHVVVVDYLRDTRMHSGITVPIRMAGGGLATFTAMRLDGDDADLDRQLSAVGYLGHVLHDAIMAGMSPDDLRTTHVRLTPRERQCLSLCASGMTAKEIAHELRRSVPTVTLHLSSVTRKLGARNRFHAVALAGYYRLLDSPEAQPNL
ncbi:helix-turn-helix transcriptional regulator [Tropicimonas sp.]|uniref:helix-turn-helix transcriptional regulator n=1 Tax=Tropicimonas sp. TaxID=2067044 RepID=UPI003A857E52